jgi:uncharacterized cupin superfamily protein
MQMKEYQVKNLNAIAPQTTNRDGNVFHVKPMFDEGLLQKCAAQFIEVEPGSAAFSYHYHESVEEVFYIISGEGSVRTFNGDVAVKAGDAITFPVGKGGSHVIRNASQTEKLVYIDFGTRGECEVVHCPDIDKIMVISKEVFGLFDEPKASN